MGVLHTAEGCVAHVIEAAVVETELAKEEPDVIVRPIEYWVDSHELGPAFVCRVKRLQIFAVRVG